MKREDYSPGDRIRLAETYRYKGESYTDSDHPKLGEFGVISYQIHQDKRPASTNPDQICVSWPQGLKWTDVNCIELIGRAGDYVSDEEMKETLESLGKTNHEPLIKLRDVITVLNAHEQDLLDSGQVVDLMRATLGISDRDDASVLLAKTIKLTTRGEIALQTMAQTATFFQDSR